MIKRLDKVLTWLNKPLPLASSVGILACFAGWLDRGDLAWWIPIAAGVGVGLLIYLFVSSGKKPNP